MSASAGKGSPSSADIGPGAASAPAPKAKPVMHYTPVELMQISAMDDAAGKANLAMMNGGLYEGRTATAWCGVVTNLTFDLVKGHAVSWGARLDHATDDDSRTAQMGHEILRLTEGRLTWPPLSVDTRPLR